MAQCDAQDGVGDGEIRDPRVCHWNPGSLGLMPQQVRAFEADEATSWTQARPGPALRWCQPGSSRDGGRRDESFLAMRGSGASQSASANLWASALNERRPALHTT